MPIPAKRILAVTLLILCTAPLLAQTTRRKSRLSFLEQDLKKGGTANIKADSQEHSEELSILQGNVTIEYQDIKVQADKITYNRATQEITAEGHVVIDQGTQRLSAERAQYNLDSKAGTFFKAKGAFDPSIYFSGEKIEKLDENTFRLTHGVVTSCDITDPDWSFRVGSGLVTIDEYARLRNLAFFADRVPIFYLPFLVWPTKRDRARGFLIPRVGSNQQFGSYIENSYFIPLGEWMDATLRADFYSEGAIRGGTIFRYVPSSDTTGTFEGYMVRDPERNKAEWRYAYRHTQEGLPGGFRAVVDVKDFSNLDFFKTFEREFELRTISSIYSSGYLTRNRPEYSLNIRVDRREHFLPSFEAFQRSVVFEQIPSVQYNVYPKQLGGSPVYFSLESSASQLRRKEQQLSAFLSSRYLRGDLFPTISMQLKTPSWISVKPQVSLRETYYSSSVDLQTGRIADEPLSRGYAQGQVEVVGPSLSRIYNAQVRDFVRFKHVIEPRVRYLYTTKVDEQNRVIQFDTVDSPFLPLVADSVEYSLTQRLLAKGKADGTSAREVMSVTLRQSVSLSEPFRVTAAGEHHFTPLSLNIRVNPYSAFTFDTNAAFGNISQQLDQMNISANLSSKQRYLNFNWFAAFAPPGQTSGDSSQFRVSGGSPVWRDKLRADLHLNYDSTRKQFLEKRYATMFTASCWGVTLEAREFLELRGLLDAQTRRDYQITVDLKNVGPLRGSF
jgi:LPS-assembly protein